MDILISALEIGLYEDLLALWKMCEGIGLSEADSRENINAYLERNPEMSFTAELDGRIIGSILGGHDGRRGYLHHLAVHPSYRGKGIASRLVTRCLSALGDSGIQKCHIFIFNTNKKGIAFWDSAGWTLRTDIGVMSKVIKSADMDYQPI